MYDRQLQRPLICDKEEILMQHVTERSHLMCDNKLVVVAVVVVYLHEQPISKKGIWAFQVSQGSVETLFRRGGKCLKNFAANLFRKLWNKLLSELPEFYRRYYKNILVFLFFRIHCNVGLYGLMADTILHVAVLATQCIEINFSNSQES